MLLLVTVPSTSQGQSVSPQTPMRIRVSERVLDGVTVKKVLQSTPCSTDSEHEKGVVTIAVLVDYDGKVKSASRLSGDPILTELNCLAISQKPPLAVYTPLARPAVITFSVGSCDERLDESKGRC